MADAVYLIDPATSAIVGATGPPGRCWASAARTCSTTACSACRWMSRACPSGRRSPRRSAPAVLHLRRPPPPRRWARDPRGGTPPISASAGASISCRWPGRGRRMALEKDMQSRESQLWFALNEAAGRPVGLGDRHRPAVLQPQMKRMLGYSPDEMAGGAGHLERRAPPRRPRPRDGHPAGAPDGKRGATRPSTACATATAATCGFTTAAGSASAMASGRRPARSACCRTSPSARSSSSRLEHLASSDTLTGLPNRRQGERFLEAELEPCRRPGACCWGVLFDVDHFKRRQRRLRPSGRRRRPRAGGRAGPGQHPLPTWCAAGAARSSSSSRPTPTGPSCCRWPRRSARR